MFTIVVTPALELNKYTSFKALIGGLSIRAQKLKPPKPLRKKDYKQKKNKNKMKKFR